ncbi:MAG: hypothetical protein L0Z50_14680 [Verrucomicrobiales bacterium]|nr:hypothetical protein [Verrucomicrobiales bacterium]
MKRVSGTYRNGTVVLDEPVDWPEGMHVEVVSDQGLQAAAEDVCLDGSPWEDSPDAVQRWLGWFDSLEPVLTAEELERFEAELRSARDEQKALLPQWEKRIANLFITARSGVSS